MHSRKKPLYKVALWRGWGDLKEAVCQGYLAKPLLIVCPWLHCLERTEVKSGRKKTPCQWEREMGQCVWHEEAPAYSVAEMTLLRYSTSSGSCKDDRAPYLWIALKYSIPIQALPEPKELIGWMQEAK